MSKEMFKEMHKKRLIKQYRKARIVFAMSTMEKILVTLCDLNPIGFGDFTYGLHVEGLDITIANMEHYFLQSYRDKEMKGCLK